MNNELFPRPAIARLEEALADTPVVLIHGPRQCGKSIFAKMAGAKFGHVYMTFDNETVLHYAKEDPVGFCASLPERVILDEVQRVPELFLSLKRIVDDDRRPGRFILTGSANVLLMPRLADSLAGRMETLNLAPLSQIEIARRARGGEVFLKRLFDGKFPMVSARPQGDSLIDRVIAGGFPAALGRDTDRRRHNWYKHYVDSITQRDIRELANVRSLKTVPSLLELAAGQTARLFNVSALAGPFELSRPTIQEYLALLERLFLIDILPPWHNNRLSRLIKTPKLHLADSGLAGALLGMGKEALKSDRVLFGQLLETFVFQELRRHATWQEPQHRFFHYRDKDQYEVDVVIEREGCEIAGVDVKASSTVTPSDLRGLKRLRDACGKRFVRGVLFYDGDITLPMGEDMFVVPYAALWEK